jgi:hypothetical protein
MFTYLIIFSYDAVYPLDTNTIYNNIPYTNNETVNQNNFNIISTLKNILQQISVKKTIVEKEEIMTKQELQLKHLWEDNYWLKENIYQTFNANRHYQDVKVYPSCSNDIKILYYQLLHESKKVIGNQPNRFNNLES